MLYGLTRIQYETLCIIQELIGLNRIAPSYREIANELGQSTPSHIPEIVRALKERGYVDYLPRRARSIRVLRPVPFPAELAGEIGDGIAGAQTACEKHKGA